MFNGFMNGRKSAITVFLLASALSAGTLVRPIQNVTADETGARTSAGSAAADSAAGATNDGEQSLASLLPLITEEAVAGMVVYPRQFFNSPIVRRLPVEVVTADMEQRLGIDLRGVEFLVAFLEQGPNAPLSMGWIIRFTDDFDWRRLPHPLLGETVFGQLHGRPYRRGKGALDLSCFALDDETLLLAPDQTLTRMVATREVMPSDQSISQQLAQGIGKSLDVHLALNTESFRQLVAIQLERLHGQASTWEAFAQLIDKMQRIELRARLTQQLAIGVVMESGAGASASDLQDFWNDWTESVAIQCDAAVETSPKLALAAFATELRPELDPERSRERIQQVTRYARRTLSEQLQPQLIKVSGNRVQWGARGDLAAQVATCAAVTMLLNPTIQDVNPLLDCWQSMDGMQRLSAAMLAYTDQHSRYPARANFDADHRPLLSWRVHLLPFLGRKELYEKFHLDEPWDSGHNRQLIRLMPTVYQNPRRPCDYRTTYMVPVGAATMFDGAEGVEQAAIRDGLGNTLMLVEADDDHAVYWTQPSDLQFDARRPWQGLGKLREAGFLGARADGTVSLFRRSLDQYQLRAFFTHNGGESHLH